MDRAGGTCALRFAALAFDERRDVPPAVGLSSDEDAQAHEPDGADDGAPLKELADAVGEREIVDEDDGVAVTRQRDVPELNATEDRAAQPADFQLCGEVLVGLPNDQAANQTLCPAGLQRRESGCDQQQEERDQEQQPPGDEAEH